MEQAGNFVLGACNIDLICYVPRLPTRGETMHGKRFAMGFGGKGANQAVMAAKLGGRVAMIGKVGSDVFGRDTLPNFHRWGVATDHGPRRDAHSPGGGRDDHLQSGAGPPARGPGIGATGLARPFSWDIMELVCADMFKKEAR